jgi:O-antigen ligase
MVVAHPGAEPVQQHRSVAERALLVLIILFLDSIVRQVVAHFDPAGEDANSPVAQAVWSVVYVFAFGGLIVERRRAAMLLRGSWPLLIVVAVALLSTFWSPDPALTAKRAFGLLGTSAIGYYFVARYNLREFLQVLIVATGISAVLSLAVVLGYPHVGVMRFEYAGAWQGIYGHKNYLASAMVIGIVATAAMLPDARGRTRLLYTFFFALFTVLLFGSRSATSLLIAAGVLAIIPLVLLLRSPRYRFFTSVALGVVVSAAVISLLMFGADIQAVFDALGRDDTLTGRTEIWPYVIQAIGDRPLFGFGYGVVWTDNGPVQQYITTDWLPYHAHNGFLELALDTGLVGLGAFLVFLVMSLARAVRYAASEEGRWTIWPLLAIVEFILANLTESSIATYNSVIWVIAVAALLFPISIGQHAAVVRRARLDVPLLHGE